MFIIFILIFYFIFVSCVLKFDIDNTLTKFVAVYIPIPAFASNDGIVEYYKYKDLKNKLIAENSEIDVKKQIQSLVVKEIAINTLMKKYGVSMSNFESYEKVIEFLKNKAIHDNTINQVAINRTEKIKKMIDDNGDFIRIATKFGDKVGKMTITKDGDLNDENIHLKDLEINEISDIIFAKDGYYVFRCYHKTKEETSLNYVFVKARTLDDYLFNYISNYKLLSFVD